MEILKFYKDLYRQQLKPNVHLDSSLLPKVSVQQLEILEKRPSIEEINLAVQECDASKSPGYDGFNFKFVKELWLDIGKEICDFVFEFFDTGRLPKEINHTWVTLIPKMEDAVQIKDFRPISMIGCLYKIIAKILAKRLSKVLPDLIGETQAAFVKDRQILDGALIANEVVWWAKKSKQKMAILKLDFQKAYDTVRWDFLEETLIGMGFGDKWTNWIMECVRTASMSILVNGSPTSPFNLQRGLRQGDPLSPFLFLLIAETFNRVILRGRELGILKGITVGANHVPITHLQFADDTIIFAPANTEIIDNYKKSLQCFGLMSGLKINYGKSTLIPLNCEENWIEEVKSLLECGVSKLPVIYLGIPLGASPHKAQTWKPIIEKVERRLALWKARTLSKAGRLVLIKAVLSSLPLYYLSLFRMPKKVAAHIILLQRRFFWGKQEGDKGGNLIAWSTIQKPIEHGGLGVGDIFVKNASLLYKWWWRFADNQRPLWKEIVESNHGPLHLEGPQRLDSKNSSSIWWQINNFKSFNLAVQEVAKNGLQIKVGNGAHTRFWLDHWVGETSLQSLFPRLFLLSTQKNSFVADMGEWVLGSWKWSFFWRRKLFAWEEELFGEFISAVNRICLRENARDVRVWSWLPSKSFSVSNFVLQVTTLTGKDETATDHGRLAWRNLAPPKAQLHVWFILQGRLNTKDRLFKFGVTGVEDDRCTFCKEDPETIEHLFFSCRFSSKFWYYCSARWNISLCLPNQPGAFLMSWLGIPLSKVEKQIWIALFYVISWSIWDIRNKIIFQKFKPNWDFEKKIIFGRLGSWMRGWCSEFPFSPGHVMENFEDIKRWARGTSPRRR